MGKRHQRHSDEYDNAGEDTAGGAAAAMEAGEAQAINTAKKTGAKDYKSVDVKTCVDSVSDVSTLKSYGESAATTVRDFAARMTYFFMGMLVIDFIVIGIIFQAFMSGDITKCSHDVLTAIWLGVGVIGGFPMHFLIDHVSKLFTFRIAFGVETVATYVSIAWLMLGTTLTISKPDCANLPLFFTAISIVIAHWILFFTFVFTNLLSTLPAVLCKLWNPKA